MHGGERKEVRSFRIEPYLSRRINELSEERKITFSDMVRILIVNGMLSEEIKNGLTKDQQEYIRLKNVKVETDGIKFVRSVNAEKLFFIKNIKKQIYLYALNRKDIILEDVIRNMELNLKIAKANGWTQEEKKIADFLESIMKENPDMLDGEKNEKKLEESDKMSGV